MRESASLGDRIIEILKKTTKQKKTVMHTILAAWHPDIILPILQCYYR